MCADGSWHASMEVGGTPSRPLHNYPPNCPCACCSCCPACFGPKLLPLTLLPLLTINRHVCHSSNCAAAAPSSASGPSSSSSFTSWLSCCGAGAPSNEALTTACAQWHSTTPSFPCLSSWPGPGHSAPQVCVCVHPLLPCPPAHACLCVCVCGDLASAVPGCYGPCIGSRPHRWLAGWQMHCVQRVGGA